MLKLKKSNPQVPEEFAWPTDLSHDLPQLRVAISCPGGQLVEKAFYVDTCCGAPAVITQATYREVLHSPPLISYCQVAGVQGELRVGICQISLKIGDMLHQRVPVCVHLDEDWPLDLIGMPMVRKMRLTFNFGTPVLMAVQERCIVYADMGKKS